MAVKRKKAAARRVVHPASAQRAILVKREQVPGGADLFRPICDTAKDFALIANAKRLTPHVLNIVRRMGFVVITS